MRALQFTEFGPASNLRLVELPDPQADAATAIVKVAAGAISPSDVKNVEGTMEHTTLPRVPGRDYAGTVIDGPIAWLGAEVCGTGGEIGYSVDGSHAELIAVPVASLRRKPNTLSLEQAAAIGVTYLAAWLGLAVGVLRGLATRPGQLQQQRYGKGGCRETDDEARNDERLRHGIASKPGRGAASGDHAEQEKHPTAEQVEGEDLAKGLGMHDEAEQADTDERRRAQAVQRSGGHCGDSRAGGPATSRPSVAASDSMRTSSTTMISSFA